MKTVETQLAEGLQALKAKSSVKFNQVLRETSGKPVEQQLAIVKDALSESVRVPKNNGADSGAPYLFEENDPSTWHWAAAVDEGLSEADQVRQLAKDMRVSVREASIFLGLPDPGKDAKFSAELQETLADKWEPMKGLLSESEIKQLVAKGVAP